jgi:hypothetical protein
MAVLRHGLLWPEQKWRESLRIKPDRLTQYSAANMVVTDC